MNAQRVQGQGDYAEHTHPEQVHSHDHYHISHHHRGGLMTGWDHRTYWHTHQHDHSVLAHSHDYSIEDEERDHNVPNALG